MLLSLLLFFNYFKRRLKLARRFHRKLPVKCNFQRPFTTYSLKELEQVQKCMVKFQGTTRKNQTMFRIFSRKIWRCYFTYLHWKKYVASWGIKNIEQNKSLV